jgi:hypothetical protein
VGYGVLADADTKAIGDLVAAWKKRDKKAGVAFVS